MGSIAVVTTFSRQGHRVYGQRMLDSFIRYWPAGPNSIRLHVYYEGAEPYEDEEESAVLWHSLDVDKDRAAFVERHMDHPFDYRKQPVKFCHKVFAVTAAPRDTDFLIWLDGDIETKAPVTYELLESLMGPTDIVAYLGRDWWKHTEAGFVMYRLNFEGQQFLDSMRAVYNNADFSTFPHQHDCYVFDLVHKQWAGPSTFNDLGKDYHGPSLDVMAASPLGAVMWHNKGNKRKREAYGAVA